MADNTTLNPGTAGDIVATDDVTDGGVAQGAKVQRVKAGWGVDNQYKDPSHTTPFPATSAGETNYMSAAGTLLTPKFAAISLSSSGNNTLVAGVSGKKIRVLSYSFVVGGTVSVKFVSATTPDLTGAMPFTLNGGISVPYNPVGHFETVASDALTLNLNAAVGVYGHLTYVEI